MANGYGRRTSVGKGRRIANGQGRRSSPRKPSGRRMY